MNNTPLTDWRDLTAVGKPQVHIALVEKTQQTAPVQIILPHTWKHQVLAYAPQRLQQQMRGTEDSIQKQLQIGLFWPIPEQAIVQAYEEFLAGPLDTGICLKLAPEQRSVYLPALFEEPKAITDTRLSQLHIFFVPRHDHQYSVELPIKSSRSSSSLARSLFSSTQTIPFKGISPLFLKTAQEHLFLDMHWQSETCLCLSLGMTDLPQWKRNFIEKYTRHLQEQTGLAPSELEEVAEQFFAHYLVQIKLEPCFVERVESLLQKRASFAKVVINQ
ncbi:hypothetical protein HAT2_00127 [Candidatus Similichlamydia laticola]|uniref:Uncharacterized protein n=2 Tax=Candidatus Similichlamydia laticola TaxID=2170265 RepID=A0A369KFR6_9BACT|nr:hypothetical protein HAT2_00127 [Candidatus Similichlamydia laticola]